MAYSGVLLLFYTFLQKDRVVRSFRAKVSEVYAEPVTLVAGRFARF